MYSTIYNRETKEWRGRDVLPLFNPQISIGQLVLDAMATYGSKIAQISDDNGVQLTYDEIRMKTIRAAQNLLKRGYKPRQVFGFVAKNSHDLAPIVFASLSIGCPVNAVDPSFGKVELVHLFETTRPVVLFCDLTSYDLVKKCLLELNSDATIYTFGGTNGDSECVEQLFSETCNEQEFVYVDIQGHLLKT